MLINELLLGGVQASRRHQDSNFQLKTYRKMRGSHLTRSLRKINRTKPTGGRGRDVASNRVEKTTR